MQKVLVVIKFIYEPVRYILRLARGAGICYRGYGTSQEWMQIKIEYAAKKGLVQ